MRIGSDQEGEPYELKSDKRLQKIFDLGRFRVYGPELLFGSMGRYNLDNSSGCGRRGGSGCTRRFRISAKERGTNKRRWFLGAYMAAAKDGSNYRDVQVSMDLGRRRGR